MGDPLDISGKNVMITGASSGIGTEFSVQMAERGAKLVLTARNEARLREVAEKIRENYGADRIIDVIPADLANPENRICCFSNCRTGGFRSISSSTMLLSGSGEISKTSPMRASRR